MNTFFRWRGRRSGGRKFVNEVVPSHVGAGHNFYEDTVVICAINIRYVNITDKIGLNHRVIPGWQVGKHVIADGICKRGGNDDTG